MIDLCSEYGDIVAIIPIPSSLCHHTIPFCVHATSVPAASIMLLAVGLPDQPGYVPSGIPTAALLFRHSGFYVNGSDLRARAGTIITIAPHPTAKASAKKTVDGTSFTAKVSAHTDEETQAVQQFVNEIAGHEAFDLFIVMSDDKCFLLRGIFPASNLQYDQQLPLYSGGDVTFEIHCVNGFQAII